MTLTFRNEWRMQDRGSIRWLPLIVVEFWGGSVLFSFKCYLLGFGFVLESSPTE